MDAFTNGVLVGACTVFFLIRRVTKEPKFKPTELLEYVGAITVRGPAGKSRHCMITSTGRCLEFEEGLDPLKYNLNLFTLNRKLWFLLDDKIEYVVVYDSRETQEFVEVVEMEFSFANDHPVYWHYEMFGCMTFTTKLEDEASVLDRLMIANIPVLAADKDVVAKRPSYPWRGLNKDRMAAEKKD